MTLVLCSRFVTNNLVYEHIYSCKERLWCHTATKLNSFIVYIPELDIDELFELDIVILPKILAHEYRLLPCIAVIRLISEIQFKNFP